MKKNFNYVSICLILFFAGACSFNLNAQSFAAQLNLQYYNSQCENNAVFLDALPNDTSLYSYSWTCPSGVCPNLWTQSGASASFFSTFNQLANEEFSVTITKISSGETSIASVTVIIYPEPNGGYSYSTVTGCEGSQLAIYPAQNNPAYGPYTINWDYNSSSSLIADSFMFTFGPAMGLVPDVLITNGYGCSASNFNFLLMYGSPTPHTTISANSPTTFCAGNNVELICEATHPSYTLQNLTYQWKKYSINLSDTVSSFSATATGRYRCIASANGCTSTSNYIDVTVNPLPTVTVSPSGSVGYCIGQPASLVATSPTAISYQWKRYGNILSGQVNNSLVVSTAGKYKSIVQDANGCVRVSAPVEVVGPPNNQVSASGPLTFCQGSSVTFTAAAGYSYQWKKRANGNYVDIPLATNQSYTATASGKYKVFVTNSSTGCTVSSAAKTVNVNCRLAGESNVALDVEVYPNPFQSQITLSLPDEWNESIIVMLYDLSGRLVYQMESASIEGNELDLPIANLKNGTYMLQVITNDDQFKKVIVKN